MNSFFVFICNVAKTFAVKEIKEKSRGEARPDISSIVITLPIDLLRAEMLISHDVITQDFLEKVVDEIFLPLVRNG